MNPEKDRKRLFKVLNDFIAVSQKKFNCNHGKNANGKEKRAWARVGITAINAYGKLLDTHELEQLAKDVEDIKETLAKQKTPVGGQVY